MAKTEPNMANPLISVIIPTFNREDCVRRALDSVLAQTFKNFEVVVVDDGSSDGSLEILKGYGDAIRLISQKNAGCAAARNAGIRAARGKWIAFLDSDDEWRPEKLECQIKYLEKYGARICYSRCVAENGQPLPDIEEITSTLKEPGIHHVTEPVEFISRARCHPYLQSMVLEKQLFDTAGYFEETQYVGEDTLWIFNLSFLSDCIYVDRPMTIIHRHTDNSLTYDIRPGAAEKRYNALIRMQAEIYWRLRTMLPNKVELTRGRLGYVIVCRAELACATGDFRLARSLAWDALLFAANFRMFLHTAALLVAPQLMQARFRKKWHRK